MSTLKPSRQTFRLLITEGLHYCCPWAFFKLYKRTALIAERLGLSTRAIRMQKARFKAGEFSCEDCANCLKRKGALKR